jgi:phage terminase large subunit-like protein
MVAGLVLAALFCDGERGAQVYSAAADRDQAALIYRQCKGMVLQDADLSKHAKVYETAKSIVIDSMGSSYKAISAEANTKHGYNTHFAVIDELHAQPNRDLVDVLKTSTGARRQPLIVHITTSDFDRPSICNELHGYAGKVRDGIVEDCAFLPVIYEAKQTDDWTDPAVWHKANPNLGVSVSLEYLERECRQAKETPSYENTFKRLHLNIRTEQDVRWMQMDKWDACAEPIDFDSLRGQKCWAGLDLASTTDIAAFALWFPDASVVLPFFWMPSDQAHVRERRDRVPYSTWERDGLIEMTTGNVIDYSFIRRRINELKVVYDIADIAYDPWNAQQFATQLKDEDGMNVTEFRQGFISMNEPTKRLERLVLEGALRHGGNKVLRWMASNVSVRTDPAGNIKIDKQKSTEKVDGIVALAMALGRAGASNVGASVYEGRGILTL